jgi:hypothetical protein
MKGYLSEISEKDLIRKREEYWNTRIEGDKEIWDTLKMCCSEETNQGIINLFIYS